MEERIEKLEEYVKHHEEDIKDNRIGISSNSQKIESNTGAIEVLHTIKTYNTRFFIMWIVTFIAFMSLLGYTIYLLNDMQRITTTQEIEDVDTISGNVTNGDVYGEN